RSEGDGPFGATKLNKLLFFSDFLAYRKFGKSITGHPYQKLNKGPAPRALVPIREQLEAEEAIALAERDYHGYPQKRVLALREADLSRFSSDEIALVTALIEEYWGRTATQLSDLSHEFRGWQLAEYGEDIPYELMLVEFKKESQEDLEIDKALREELLELKAQCS
ncbi:MAG: SocA family protein, partial [Planctomycetes bacterium]|nr:SocA family protein [Planctomycetota bacterium]